LLRQVDVELHLRIGRAKQEEVPDGVRANLVQHFFQRDAHPGPLRHPDRLRPALDRDKLHQQDGQTGGVDPEYGERVPEASDLALVVGAPHVDHAVEPPFFEFVSVIEDV